MAEFKRCKQPFAVEVGGVTRVVPAGEVVSTDDPVFSRSTREFFEGIGAHVDRVAERRAATVGSVEAATADPGTARTLTPPTPPADPDLGAFDPGIHPVREVLAYLADADEEERERVLAAEAAGQARKGILGDGPES
ncbi:MULTISPECIES: hypothetical protein [Actinomycetes]|uniref:hypothetical protein n=1 Tax=Actinomycetes TaxID=1760 RepID=UPI0033D60304